MFVAGRNPRHVGYERVRLGAYRRPACATPASHGYRRLYTDSDFRTYHLGTERVLRDIFDWPSYDLHEARQRLQRIVHIVEPKSQALADEQITVLRSVQRKRTRNIS